MEPGEEPLGNIGLVEALRQMFAQRGVGALAECAVV